MSDQDLRKLYDNIRRGDEYVAPRREGELYDVINEANMTINYADGTTATIELSDERAKELEDISKISTVRNQALYKIDGQWVGRRLDKGQIKDLVNITTNMSDNGTIEKRIRALATKATIFNPKINVPGYDNQLQAIREFLVSTAHKTLTAAGKSTERTNLKKEVFRILLNIESGQYQKALIDKLSVSGDDVASTFNLWEVLLGYSTQGESTPIAGTLFDVESHQEMITLRPESDNAATRGAAGPGEALIAFIYGGVKPNGVGDILLDSDPNDTIELKKQKGRIGKDILMTSSRKKYIESLFYGKTGIKQESQDYYRDLWNQNWGKMFPVGDNEPMVQLKKDDGLPQEFYSRIIDSQATRPESEPGILIFPESLIKKSNNSVAAEKKNFKLTDKRILTNALINTGFFQGKISTRPIKAEMLAGKFRTSMIDNLKQITVQEFLDNSAGTGFGKYVDNENNITVKSKMETPEPQTFGRLNLDLPQGNVWDVIQGDPDRGVPGIPGETPMDKIGNLIGVWHLKHYLTHIQPFKWLLVFDVDGTAAGITYEKIISEPIVSLLEIMTSRGLYFGIRKDNQGFDIQVAS